MLRNALVWLVSLLILSGCATVPPQDRANLCRIFQEYPEWYWDAQEAEHTWGVPIAIQMAIMHQESRFDGGARPPRKQLMGFIPWTRPSSSFGYAQALKPTWELYRRDARRYRAMRDDFGDAVDFIGWYVDRAHRRAGISKTDTYRIYLSYHEGIIGYQRHTDIQKPWLHGVAAKVTVRAQQFHAQLEQCRDRLPKRPWYRFW